MRAVYLSIALIGLGATGCSKGSKEAPAAGDRQAMAMDSGKMLNMSGMGDAGMMPMMQAHMDSMMKMTPDQIAAMMGSHERMMSQMMDRMGGDMRQMQMAENSEWTALADSIRQDLAELPSLSGQKLRARMQIHSERVGRLMAAHEQMMRGMR